MRSTSNRTGSHRRAAGRSNGKTLDELQQRIRDLEHERDTYRRALYKLLPKERIQLTKKELREMDRSNLTLARVIEELRKL